jgi:hypothetical protein
MKKIILVSFEAFVDRMENADLTDLDEEKRKHLQYVFLINLKQNES